MTSICCICEIVTSEMTMHPARCYRMHGSVAHKVCTDCWWRKTGFAEECGNHNCPGCIKNIPLNYKSKRRHQSIDLSEFVMDLTNE